MLLSELARRLGASLVLPASWSVKDASEPASLAFDPDIAGVATLESADASHVSFLTNPKYAAKLTQTRAAAVIVGAAIADLELAQLVHKNPYAAMAKASQIFWPGPTHHARGQSELASVHPTARVHPTAILYPFCYVDANAEVGEHTVLYPNVYIGAGSYVGARCVIYPSVTVMHGCRIEDGTLAHAGSVIGGDGFGFAPNRDGIEKIPQIGGVVIGPDCEIGPLCTIDRGAFNDTSLARGCKLDSQVHIGHGTEVGEFGLICGQAAIAGSTKIGRRLVMAGHSAIGPSLEIGDSVTLGPKCGMTRSTAEAGEYLGMPAVPAKDWRRQVVALKELPELLRKVRDMSARIAELESKLESSPPTKA